MMYRSNSNSRHCDNNRGKAVIFGANMLFFPRNFRAKFDEDNNKA